MDKIIKWAQGSIKTRYFWWYLIVVVGLGYYLSGIHQGKIDTWIELTYLILGLPLLIYLPLMIWGPEIIEDEEVTTNEHMYYCSYCGEEYLSLADVDDCERDHEYQANGYPWEDDE